MAIPRVVSGVRPKCGDEQAKGRGQHGKAQRNAYESNAAALDTNAEEGDRCRIDPDQEEACNGGSRDNPAAQQQPLRDRRGAKPLPDPLPSHQQHAQPSSMPMNSTNCTPIPAKAWA